MIRTGTATRMPLSTDADSDLPGMLTAQVSRGVYGKPAAAGCLAPREPGCSARTMRG